MLCAAAPSWLHYELWKKRYLEVTGQQKKNDAYRLITLGMMGEEVCQKYFWRIHSEERHRWLFQFVLHSEGRKFPWNNFFNNIRRTEGALEHLSICVINCKYHSISSTFTKRKIWHSPKIKLLFHIHHTVSQESSCLLITHKKWEGEDPCSK